MEVLDSKPLPDVSSIELAHRHDCGDESCDHIVQDEADNPTPTAALPETLTPKQLGQLRRLWVTQTNGTVKACGHKDNFSFIENKRAGKPPNNNCIYCWEAYFMTSVDLDLIHTVLTTKGGKALVAMKGTKFVRMFHGFLSTKMLPMLAAEVNAANKNPETDATVPATIVGGTFGNGNEGSEVPAVGSTQPTVG
jgi:hypothetical protein